MKSIIISVSLLISLFSLNDRETFQSIFQNPQIVEISATLRFDKCNNKAFVPIDLPPSTKGWIYTISTINKNEMRSPKNRLLEQVQLLSEKHSSDKMIDHMIPIGKQNEFNLYILNGKDQAESFYNCGCYKYVEKHIGTKSRNGYIKNNHEGTYFIAIENAHDLKHLRLKIEAVSVS